MTSSKLHFFKTVSVLLNCIQGLGRLDTLPAALLYLEAMEAAQAQNAGLSSIGRGS